MRDGDRELAERGHARDAGKFALTLPQFFFRALSILDLNQRTVPFHDVSVDVQQGILPQVEPAILAIGPPDAPVDLLATTLLPGTYTLSVTPSPWKNPAFYALIALGVQV